MSEEQLRAILARRPQLHLADSRVTGAQHEAAKAKAKAPRAESYLEALLAAHLEWAGMPPAEREYRFSPTRKFRIDFAWPAFRLAVEVQGEVHRIKGRFDSDLAKVQALTLAGWRYLPIGSADIRSGAAIPLIKTALAIFKEIGDL